MKHVFSLLIAVAVVAISTTWAFANPVNATGHWRLQLTTGQGLTSGYLTLNQVGSTVVGKLSTGGTINGQMVSDTKVNAKWNGPQGAGWITLYFKPDGKSFSGDWGFNGKKPSGSFVGQPIEPPKPALAITANGRWRVKLASGEGLGSGDMMLHQAGAAVVGKVGDVTIDGKMVSADKVAATWKGSKGGGWLSLWLDNDGSSLHGEWGWNGKPKSGRLVAYRVEGR